MKEGSKFRNHISIVAEEIRRSVIVLLAVSVTQILPQIVKASSEEVLFWRGKMPWIIPAAVVFLAAEIGIHLFVWSKTYISVDENAIIIEKGTVNKKKNTIGIKNISNINFEQNLFEMFMGTCKIKLDTNSLSTADKTDVKIILKKADAENFCRIVSLRLGAEGTAPAPVFEMDTASAEIPGDKKELPGEEYDIRADIGDIMRHGFYSVSLISAAVLLGGILVSAGTVYQAVNDPGFVRSLAGALAGILVTGTVIVSALWDTLKDFIRYYDFRVKRKQDHLYIRYGLLKKMEYTVPVEKIQALKINQSFIARISGYYMAEIVNVGMGDEAEEKNSFLILYCRKSELKQRLGLLLPELSGTVGEELQKQPAAVWFVWAPKFAAYAVLAAGAAGVFQVLNAGVQRYVWLTAAAWGGASVFVLCTAICMVMNRKTSGIALGENTLLVCRGYFGRKYTVVQYSNIQYVKIFQNIIAKKAGVKKGEIRLLASALNASRTLPYFRDGLEEQLKRNMLSGRQNTEMS